jgi:stearoyl-CoA desaturase (delta-9 desaturase)
VFKGVFLYVKAAKDKVMVDTYGVGTPIDWMERNVYSIRPTLGIGILFLFNTWLFGWIGILIWGIQMIWIPFWAAGVVNGIGHYFGYRNGDSKDNSKNFSPIGILIGGEELHNNHHLSPGSPKLSIRWYEFDVGYFYLMILKYLGLAKVKQL